METLLKHLKSNILYMVKDREVAIKSALGMIEPLGFILYIFRIYYIYIIRYIWYAINKYRVELKIWSHMLKFHMEFSIKFSSYLLYID